MQESIKSRPTIFLVEEDNNVRPYLTKHLRQSGYHVLVSAAMEDAIEWLSSDGHIHADLVLVNLLGKKPGEALEIGRSLRAYGNYHGNTPLIVMPEVVPRDLEGVDEKVTEWDWICYYEGDQLQRLVARLLKTQNGDEIRSTSHNPTPQ